MNVTPEMIEAGRKVFLASRQSDSTEEMLSAIYLAMRSKDHSPQFSGHRSMSRLDIGYAVHSTLPAALWASLKRTFRTWRYARSVGADPTHWWGVYEGGTEVCLASVGPLPGAEERARKIADALEDRTLSGGKK